MHIVSSITVHYIRKLYIGPSGLSKSNFQDHYGDVVIKQCLGKIAEINEFSASATPFYLSTFGLVLWCLTP